MSKAAQSIREFCDENGFSKATLYNLLKRGQGPAIMKVGRRSLISAEAAALWRRSMEQPIVDNQRS
jgi:predicted DNA-binding transcriptional regulator AlpA